MLPSLQAERKEVTIMRSWYLVMSIFIGVIMVLILLFSTFNNGCTITNASLITPGNTSSYQLNGKNGENALPWQLDAVSIGTVHTPAEKYIPSTSEVQEISCMGRSRPMKSSFPNAGVKAQG
jgi:hypothetical protein